jgi:hypothetical protein
MISSALLLLVLHRWGLDLGLGRGWALLAPAMLAVNRSYAAWATGGLETRFFSLLLVAAGWRLHVESRRLKAMDAMAAGARHDSAVVPWSAAILALACLTRPEGLLAAVVASIGMLLALRASHRVTRRAHAAASVGILLLSVGAHEAWRVAYYGAWLPNTYYAKVAGPRLVSGAFYLATFASHHLVLPGACLFAAVALEGRTIAARIRSALGDSSGPAAFAAPFTLMYLAYAVAVGGDHFEFRFMDPVLPLIYLMAALAAASLSIVPPGKDGRRLRPAAALIGAALIAGAGISSVTGFRDVERTYDLAGDRRYVSIVSIETESGYLRHWEQVGRWLRDNADPSDSIAVAPSGAIPYLSGLRSLDMHGLNDAEIARLPVKPGMNVGHERWADLELIRSRGITYYIGDPRIQRERAHDLPGNPVEVRLGDRWFYFWVLTPGARIMPGYGANRLGSSVVKSGT